MRPAWSINTIPASPQQYPRANHKTTPSTPPKVPGEFDSNDLTVKRIFWSQSKTNIRLNNTANTSFDTIDQTEPNIELTLSNSPPSMNQQTVGVIVKHDTSLKLSSIRLAQPSVEKV